MQCRRVVVGLSAACCCAFASSIAFSQNCVVDGAADVNGDCVVDPLDTGFVLSRFNCAVGSGDAGCDAADANADGKVDPLDSGFVLSRFCTGVDYLGIALDAVGESTNEAFVTLTGTTKGAETIEVVGGEFPVIFNVVECAFSGSVILIPNRINFLFLTAIAEDGTRGPAFPVTITQDDQPPFVYIDFPSDGAELTTNSTDVAGRVSDLLSGFAGLMVEVNGVKAIVDVGIGTNGTFLATQVPLEIGENTVVATATDFLGNSASHTITVNRVEIPEGSRVMTVVSGNGQSSEVFTELPDPIVVRVTSVSGKPQAGKVVTFQVTRNDGLLSAASNGLGSAMLQVFTDANGEARAFWRLGGTAGCGNNRVEVTSNDVLGSTFFCATGTAGAPDQINVGSGNMQRGEAGGLAPEKLVAWVSDSCNPVPFVPVTFTVVSGGGLVNGEQSETIVTDLTGHAEVEFTLGPDQGNNVVSADTLTNTGPPIGFTIYGTKRISGRTTSFAGIVLNNAQNPIQGATCTIEVGDQIFGPIDSDIDGRFEFFNIASAGAGELSVDGATAFHVGGINGHDIPLNTYPALHYAVVLTPEAENGLGMPVLLPPLNPDNGVLFDNTQDVELTCEGIAGLKMIVKAGSVTLIDGSVPSPQSPTILSINQVHHDDVPMPMPDGVDPPFAWTLQPGGTRFDPPVEIVYPNMGGLPPGALSNFLSFNHDTMRFEIVATGTVSADGQVITSDPGSGIATAGWGCNCPPYSVTSGCCHCNENCQVCVAELALCITTCSDGGVCCGPNGCCTPPNQCCGGDQCILPDKVCCPDHGSPCAADETCCGSNCCGADEACCGSVCCPSLEQCCETDVCCEAGEKCCDAGVCIDSVDDVCCNNGEGGSCPIGMPQCCGTTCCGDTDVCCIANGESTCHPNGSHCCDDGTFCDSPMGVCCVTELGPCAPDDSECCPQGGFCDPPNSVCCPGGCAPTLSTCCGSSFCQSPNSVCCNDACKPDLSECCSDGHVCSPPTSECCGATCCADENETCCNGVCIVDKICCPDGHQCDFPGQKCCGSTCCGDDQPCCSASGGTPFCGSPGSECCQSDDQCAFPKICCGTSCCDSGQVCCDGECHPAGTQCCGEGTFCEPPNPVCCPGGCAAANKVCCPEGNIACDTLEQCCVTGCCPAGQICCDGGCVDADLGCP